MKHPISLCSISIAALVLATPATGFAKKDKDHHHHSSSHAYCPPSYGYRSSYYSRPSVSFGFYSAPTYYSTPDYYYDSYPSRTYYRSVPRTSYSYRERSSYSEDLAVDVQRALARRGYYRGGIDGDVGPGTRAAIRSYQYNRGLTVTGRIDGSLLRSLGLS